MLNSQSFHKKTRKGGVVKVVKEHYLRDDIGCGLLECDSCSAFQGNRVLSLNELKSDVSSVATNRHLLFLDTNIVLQQIDLLEDLHFNNLIICQTVIEEVKHLNVSIYKRLLDLAGHTSSETKDREKIGSCIYLFSNEFHKDTYVNRTAGETVNDRHYRAIRVTAKWYRKHIDQLGAAKNLEISVILLTNDKSVKEKSLEDELDCFTIYEYVNGMKNVPAQILDKICQDNSVEIGGDGTVSMQGGRRKMMFPEHLPLAEIVTGLKSGIYRQGTIQISRDNYLEANVSIEGQEEPIFVQGLMNINRAVHGDVVAIEMLPRECWSCPSALLKISTITDSLDVKKENEMLNEIDSDDDEEYGKKEEMELREALPKSRKRKLEETNSKHLLPTGKVVGIIKRNWRPYCGILLRSPIPSAVRQLFVPAERRIPKIRLETRQAEVLTGQRIIVSIDSWPRTSRYPHGHFVKALGPVGDKATENEVILLEHDVPHDSFSQAVLDCLPSLPWIINSEDLKEREDLRYLDICSVDPPGCTDIDDALHCRLLDNGRIEAGVHIADVSHFVRPNTAIDKEACDRGTTVYLVDKRIDMLPELLSGNLCSLRGGEDRFAFSVIWEMTNEAEILTVKFTKSVIRSRAALTYAQAQAMIDDSSRNDTIAETLRRLNYLAKKLKVRRHAAGALSLASLEIRFKIDSETHDPIDVQSKQALETNSMVEEFMLLANIQVAKRILEEFPDSACLRRHPVPPQNFYKPIVDAAAAKGFVIQSDSGKSLAESLDRAVVATNPFFNTMLRILTCRCMTQALYFSSGTLEPSEYLHFGLATPIYTHFTSPIRRYADLIVHRMLAAAISTIPETYLEILDRHKMQKICNNLNYRHRMAQYAGRASVLLNTHLFFKDRVEDVEGYVLAVKKNALQILIPKYGFESAVLIGPDSPLQYNPDDNCVVCANSGVSLRTFDRVVVQLSVDSSDVQHQKLKLQLVQPKISGFSVRPIFDAPENELEQPPVKRLKKDE